MATPSPSPHAWLNPCSATAVRRPPKWRPGFAQRSRSVRPIRSASPSSTAFPPTPCCSACSSRAAASTRPASTSTSFPPPTCRPPSPQAVSTASAPARPGARSPPRPAWAAPSRSAPRSCPNHPEKCLAVPDPLGERASARAAGPAPRPRPGRPRLRRPGQPRRALAPPRPPGMGRRPRRADRRVAARAAPAAKSTAPSSPPTTPPPHPRRTGCNGSSSKCAAGARCPQARSRALVDQNVPPRPPCRRRRDTRKPTASA